MVKYKTLTVVLGAIVLASATAAQVTPAPQDSLLAADRLSAAAPYDAAAFARTFKSRFSTVNGVRLHFVSGGKGTPILLLHGWPETAYSWRKVMPALALEHTVIAIDLPGFGGSAPAPSGEKRVVAAYVHELMRSLGYTRFALLGHDMGGAVAFAVAAEHPEAVTHLIMSETAVPGHHFAEGGPNDILTVTPQNAVGIWHFAFFNRSDFAQMLIAGHERPFLRKIMLESFTNKAAFNADELDELTRWLRSPRGVGNGLAYYTALAVDAKINTTLFAAVKLAMPVLVIDGGDGFLQHVTAMSVGEVVVAITKKVVVPASGHFIAAERPAFVANEVNSFLRDH